MNKLLPQLVGYGLASGVALGVDMGTLLALTHSGANYLPASAVSYTVGAIIAYLLSVRFVFTTRRLRNRTLEVSSFVSLGLVGLLVNSLVMRIAVGSLGTTVFVAKCIAACFTFGTNFVLRRQLLFRTPDAAL